MEQKTLSALKKAAENIASQADDVIEANQTLLKDFIAAMESGSIERIKSIAKKMNAAEEKLSPQVTAYEGIQKEMATARAGWYKDGMPLTEPLTIKNKPLKFKKTL